MSVDDVTLQALWEAGLPSAGLCAGGCRTCGSRAQRLTGGAFFCAGRAGASLAGPVAHPSPSRSAAALPGRLAGGRGVERVGGRSEGLGELPGLATSRAPHSAAAGSRWGVGSRLHLGQGGWRVSGCQWAWISMRLQEVLPVCSSLSFHLPSPLLPRPPPACTPVEATLGPDGGGRRLLVLKSRPQPTWCCGKAGRGRLL